MERQKPREGKQNRAIIIAELLKNPQTFTQLRTKLDFSPKTLWQHLIALENQNLVRREIKGKYVVYTANKLQAISELKKQLLTQLQTLEAIYGSVLDKKTRASWLETLKTLKESIRKQA